MSESNPHEQVVDRRIEDRRNASAQENAIAPQPLELNSNHTVDQPQTLNPHLEENRRDFEIESLLHNTPHEALTKQNTERTNVIATNVPGAELPPQANSSATGEIDLATREQTIIDGLLSILASIRDDVRSYRVLLISNLILIFTIPLSALAVQQGSIFKSPSLWIISHPARWLFASWLVGLILMLIGALFIWPSAIKGTEGLASHRTKEAARYLAQWNTDRAIKSIINAIEKEDERLRVTNWSRWFFFFAFVLFLACVTLEFALMLFS